MIVARLLARARTSGAPLRRTSKTLGAVATLLAALTGTARAEPPVESAPAAAPSPALAPPPVPPRVASPIAPPMAPSEPTDTSGEAGSLPAHEQTTDDGVRAALSSWGCEPSAVLVYQQRWYAACGVGGVLVVSRREGESFVLSERRAVPGRAHGLFVHEQTVWVESTRTEAHPFDELSSSVGAADPRTVPTSHRAGLPHASAEASAVGPAYSKLTPPRRGRLLRVQGGFRPYLPMRSLGVATLADATVTYHGERAWYVQGQLQPLGGTATRGQDATVFGGAASAGYDHPYFAVGLGLGTLRRGDFHLDFDPIQHRTREWGEHSFGLSVTQALRVGALDGLSLSFANAFVLDAERWRFGYFDLRMQFPINRQTWLTLSGGGAQEADFLYAEVGLRRLIHGDLGAGTLFVEPSVGVAGVDNRIDGVGPGPMIGCHLEWRK